MMDTLKQKKNYTLILVLCASLFTIFQMAGCATYKLQTTIVNDDVAQNTKKGYVRFEFTNSKTTGEAVFDVGVKVAIAALGGGGNNSSQLEVAKVLNEMETPMFQLRVYDIEYGWNKDANSRWAAESPGQYTYRITFLKPMITFFSDQRTVFADVTVEVQENKITPVKIYFTDFFDYKGKPKKAEAARKDSKDIPNLDMGSAQIMNEERFHVGDPYPVADEQNKNFAKNIKD